TSMSTRLEDVSVRACETPIHPTTPTRGTTATKTRRSSPSCARRPAACSAEIGYPSCAASALIRGASVCNASRTFAPSRLGEECIADWYCRFEDALCRADQKSAVVAVPFYV